MKLSTKYLTLTLLFLLASCDDTRYYYSVAPGEKAIAVNADFEKTPGLRLVGPYFVETHVDRVDSAKLNITFAIRLIPKRTDGRAIELSCLEFEALVGGKKLKKITEFCPTGADLLSKKYIAAHFATPEGTPLNVDVKIPEIKILSHESDPFQLSSYSVGFLLHQYSQGFSMH